MRTFRQCGKAKALSPRRDMNPRVFIFLIAIALLVPCGSALSQGGLAQAQGGPAIYGKVTSKTQGPVGSVTVSLVNTTLGRNTPAFTKADGSYFFRNVPAGQTYYIEAYWGNKLLYRGKVDYKGGSVTHDISLP